MTARPTPPTHPDWCAARTFDDLCELGARFIEGETLGFPGWLPGELDEAIGIRS